MSHSIQTKRFFTLLTVLVVLVSAGGCGWRPASSPKVAIYLNIASFYQPGRTWTYETSYQASPREPEGATVTVIGTEDYHGIKALRIDSTFTNSSQKTWQYMTFHDTTATVLGIVLFDSATHTLTDHAVLPGVLFPAVLAPGVSFSSQYATTESGVEVQWSVVAEILNTSQELVVVPAGRFPNAVRVHSRVTTTRTMQNREQNSSDTAVFEEYTWYAPGVGMIKNQPTNGSQVMQLTRVTL